MSNKEDKGLYRSHSRKELQILCKRYGLPANRSRSDLAKSLTSYLENRGLGSMTRRERLYEIQEARTPLPLKLPFRDVDKDFYGLISCPANNCNGGIYPRTVECNALGCCAKFDHKDGYGGGSTFSQQAPPPRFVTQYNDSGFKHEVSPTMYFNRNCLCLTRDERMNDMPQIEHTDTNVGACSNESAFCSSINTPTVSPFQFHVSSEKGISLYVDLNSNPSDWVEKVKSKVSICQNMSHGKSQSVHEDLRESSKQVRNSFQLDVDTEKIKDSNIPAGLRPSLIVKESNALQLDHLCGDDGPLDSTVMTPCFEAVDVSQHLGGHQGMPSLKALPDFHEEIISSGASSTKDGCLTPLDSNISSPREILASDGMLDIPDGPPNLFTMKHRNSNLENEIRDNSTLQNGCNLVNSDETVPGCLLDGSLKIPMAEDVVHQKNKLHSPHENGEFVNLDDPQHNMYAEQGGLVGSTGLDQETFRNQFPILVEEQGRSKIINWKESSECSQDDSGVLDNVDSKGLGETRAYVDGRQNDCSMLDAKFLRSAKYLTRTVLPRRSMRLVSK